MADFYTDHNVSLQLTSRLRALGHNVTTARDLGFEQAGDDEHLLVAAEHGWTLVTHNRADFQLLHDAWRRWSAAWGIAATHAGILVIPQRRSGDEAAAELHAFLSVSSGDLLSTTFYQWTAARGWVRRP